MRSLPKPESVPAAGPDVIWQDKQGAVYVAEVKGASGSALRDLSDQLRQREDARAVVLGSTDDGKVALVINLDKSVTEIDAVALVRELGPLIGIRRFVFARNVSGARQRRRSCQAGAGAPVRHTDRSGIG